MWQLHDEEFLIRQCVENKDEQAFETLVRLHLPTLRRIVGATGIRNAESRDEVLQEVLIRIHQALPSFRFNASFTTWVYRITRNTALNEIRRNWRRQRREKHLSPDIVEIHNPEQKLMEVAHAVELKNLFYRLKEKERQILLLREKEHRSLKDIADILGISLGSVKSRLSRARKQARLLYEEVMK